MQILFVTPPGFGHVLPIVTTAWALRAAGHDVLVATSGATVDAPARAGLPVVNVAADEDMQAVSQRFKDAFHGSARRARGESPPVPMSGGGPFAMLGDVMADGVVTVACDWRADLVVHTPYGVAGAVAAAKLDIPAVFLGFGLAIAHTPPFVVGRIYSQMDAACQRHGIDRLPSPAAWIDVAPPSLRPAPSDGWPMRYIPYNGGGVLPDWLRERSERPRIAVTLGTVAPVVGGLGPLEGIVSAAREIDAEFVLALGSADPAALGELPPNVRPSGWIPLDTLLLTCAGIVHHGGSGTTMTALDAGLPQVVLPQGADQFLNAEAVRARGVGLAPGDAGLDVDVLHRLLEDDALRAAAGEVRAEMRNMPPPADLVPKIVALAG